MTQKPVFIISGLVAAFVTADPVVYAYNLWQDIPNNQKCEQQLRTLIQELDLPGNGASHYNPWTKQCSYRYYDYQLQNAKTPDAGKIKTYNWMPLLR